jgi:hypothetical protein
MRTISDKQVFCRDIQRVAKQVSFVDKVALFVECLRNQFLTMVTEDLFKIDRIKNVGCSLADVFQEDSDLSGMGRLVQCHHSYLLISKAVVTFAHTMDYPARYHYNFVDNERLLITINWGPGENQESFCFILAKYHLQKWLPDYILEEETISEEEEKDPQLNFCYQMED